MGLTALAALTGGTGMAVGVALASPDPAQQPDIFDAIDEWEIQYPTMLTNPLDESGPSGDWGGVGMWCNNLRANCS
ncbi:hypothetical protein [Mycobacterium sp. SMC-2]|uniref:hypothetical protein n=1 Tax=Mycobacterium sp. SMC-2 TaxID=2857058 RepID=UPI0021B19E0F|nr:hypothetical protein [Mycobacterium sp. SMC-2]